MKIIILGAGQVGSTLAENLSTEANDISVVDIRKDCLKDLQDRLDIQTIHGHAAYPQILKQAGAEDADMVVAVTGYDEVNMVACQLVWTLFRTPSKIGRVRAIEYQTQEKLFNEEAIPINVLINPERVITDHITRLIKHPGALQVLNFADNQVQLVAIKAVHAGHLVGRELRFLRQFLPSVDTRVAAIFRQNKPIVPKGSTVIEPDDEIFFMVLPVMLFFVSFVGGCAGSTGGGMKVIRILLIFKQGLREIQRLIHPNAVFSIKLGQKPISDRIAQAVWGFVSVYILTFVVLVLALMTTGLDQVTAWSAVGATINNLGPGLGMVASHYGDLNTSAKWYLCFSMLLGRLEVFTILVLVTPMFWRR